MTYKSLITVLTDEKLVAPTLNAAIVMARAHDAHLDVLCLGVDRSQTSYYFSGATALVLEQSLDRAKQEATSIEAAARKILRNADAQWSCDAQIGQMIDLTRSIGARARFSDLAVLAQPYGADRGSELEVTTEGCLFNAQVPVLTLPDGADMSTPANKIMIGWNESAEAMSAVRAALPLLRAAQKVHVVVIDPPTHGPNRSDPGGLISQFLARHGVRVEIDVLARTLPRVSDVLSRHAVDIQADMMVTGAYGHSRFREAVFGGATRDLLEHAALPVFMAH
ncbi:universal stress protein [Roseovarius aestuarii]|nr:universal stress protein [Roseovarius aestuarii]